MIETMMRMNLTTSSCRNFQCGVLMGANVANDVAQQQVCESTLACNYTTTTTTETTTDPTPWWDGNNARTKLLFDTPHFRIHCTADIVGTEICGAIKNCIALGAGFVDGIPLGSNTKAALIRIGLLEIYHCGRFFFPNSNIQYSTMMESCGVADLITTCYSGRNRLCAQVFAQERRIVQEQGTTKKNNGHKNSTEHQQSTQPVNKGLMSCQEHWHDIEARLLNGQKLQGVSTTNEVYHALSAHHILHRFPLIATIYKIAICNQPIHTIVDGIRVVVADDPDTTTHVHLHRRSSL
jgi:glycerol-3-phosphate dehydrogenase (NAD+)